MLKDLPTLEQEITARAQSRLTLDSNDIHLAFRNRFNDIINEELTIGTVTKTIDTWLSIVLAAAREKVLPMYKEKEILDIVNLVNKRDAVLMLETELKTKLAELAAKDGK